QREYLRFEHRAFPQIDQTVVKSFTVPDPRRETRIVRPADPEARPPPFRRHQPHRRDDAAVDPDPFESGMQPLEFDPPVQGGIQVLQPATAAGLEMPTARRGALWSGGEPVDHQALSPAIAAAPETRPDAVARHCERPEHR